MRMMGLVCAGFAAMRVRSGFRRDGNIAHLSVRDAAFGNDAIGERPHGFRVAAKHRNFKTILVVDMHMHGRDVKVVVIVMRAGQPLGKVAGVVVEYIVPRELLHFQAR